jgi:hypothetical protein
MMFARPDLICLGHIHLPQKYYSGSLYAQNVGENHKHGFYIHEFDDIFHGTWMSRFIETPAKKLSRISFDYTDGGVGEITAGLLVGVAVEGTFARLDFKVFQDEADKIDKEAITEIMKAAGAIGVDIRIVRVPRQNVRSEAVLKSESLRDKIQKMAELKEEQISETVLQKAELLENMSAEEILEYGGLT